MKTRRPRVNGCRPRSKRRCFAEGLGAARRDCLELGPRAKRDRV
jgi:hypothetical protein